MAMDRILTTHVGSLIRPPEVMEDLRNAYYGRDYNVGDFERKLADAVRDVVAHQADVGLDIVDDGETGKPGWVVYIYERLRGIEARTAQVEDYPIPEALDREAYKGTNSYSNYRSFDDGGTGTEANTWICQGPVIYNSGPIERDIANLLRALSDQGAVDGFIPAVAPGSISWVQNEYYPSEDEMIWAFADALHEEYKRIVDAGLLLQVDDALLWVKFATIKLQGGDERDYRLWAEPRIEALNHALRGIPEDRVRYHVCSGANHTPHAHDVPLRDIIDLILKVNSHAYLIEQANAAHEHEWRIWEDVSLPDDKILVPGVITHHTTMVEHPELVAQRITRLAKLIGRDRVMAGADCGFAQSASVQRVPVWTQWAKLQSLVHGARMASQALWGSS
jgi:5-methyltetrahydropteroyltriglutamate--homocysteine methyltransferase